MQVAMVPKPIPIENRADAFLIASTPAKDDLFRSRTLVHEVVDSFEQNCQFCSKRCNSRSQPRTHRLPPKPPGMLVLRRHPGLIYLQRRCISIKQERYANTR